jgi:hypothetical protein
MRISMSGLITLLAWLSSVEARAQGGHDPKHHRGADSAFHAMQMRGKQAMGVDQYRSSHRFTSVPEGGRIELTSDSAEAGATAAIRAHFAEIAKAFAAGDFSTPGFVHARTVPGTAVMKARAALITYKVREVPRGAELLIGTTDPAALAAIHEFLAFQRAEHHAGASPP